MALIKTGIGRVCTLLPHSLPKNSAAKQNIQALAHPSLGHDQELCWLDEMLGTSSEPGASKASGLFIPHGGNHERPYVLIVSGPPGSAKSTFALEVCYQLVENGDGSALYVTTETSDEHILKKAQAFGWKQDVFATKHLDAHGELACSHENGGKGKCLVHALVNPSQTAKAYTEGMDWATLLERLKKKGGMSPDILVIDSFNTVPGAHSGPQTKGDTTSGNPVAQLIDFCCSEKQDVMRPRMLIVVLDVHGAKRDFVEGFDYFADATVRFNLTLDDRGLASRTMEISKIKTQKHAEGVHTIEIFENPSGYGERHGSPFMRRGGLFVYPSIQWYLSRVRKDGLLEANRRGQIPTNFVAIPENIQMLVNSSDVGAQGYYCPGHTISLVGRQSVLKTRFAYATLLKNVIEANRVGLIVSLDADIKVVKRIMSDIVKAEFSGSLQGARPDDFVEALFHDDRLSFIHYEPAYISPGEFFHRVYVAFKRPRQGHRDQGPLRDKKVGFVLVDGLDQVESKFPLCAKEPLFVSALVTLFKVDGDACAIFTSSQDPDTDGCSQTSASALLPLSDLLLRFVEPQADEDKVSIGEVVTIKVSPQDAERRRITRNVLRSKRNNREPRNCVVVQALRVPFGGESEPEGTLWTDEQGQLHFHVLAPHVRDNMDDND